MIGPGLSPDQAPPVSVPFRFFLTAPLFGILAGALALVQPWLFASRWTPGMLACTHLVLLGALGSVMLGAISQMLPVVAGAPVKRPLLVGGIVHAAWTGGAALLAFGLGTSRGAAAGAGAILLACAAVTMLWGARGLLTTTVRSDSAASMKIALVSFAVVVALGVTLAFGHAGWTPLRRFTVTDLHAGWALAGWVASLIMGVSWQVVPMLLMTPAYPAILRKGAVPALWVVLAAWTLVPARFGAARSGLEIAATLVVAAWAVETVNILGQRRRRIPDATVLMFRAGCAALLLACAARAAVSAGAGLGDRAALGAAIAFALGFATGVATGMLLKIAPFLAWFHLQAAAGRDMASGAEPRPVPTMKEVLPDVAARRIAGAHLAACVLAALAPFAPAVLGRLAGVALIVSFALQLSAMVRAARIVRAA